VHGSSFGPSASDKTYKSFMTGESLGENILGQLTCLSSKTRGSLLSWFTPGVETVGEPADNIFYPNTTLVLLAKFFHPAQPLQECHKNGDASGTTLKGQVKI